MKMLRRWGWPLFTSLLIAGLGYFAIEELRELRTYPATPTPVVLSQLQQMPQPHPWMEIGGVDVRCDLTQRIDKDDVVPLLDASDTAAAPRALFVSLGKNELCATIASPVRVVLRDSPTWRSRFASSLRRDLTAVGGAVYSIETDAPGTTRVNLMAQSAALVALALALAFQLRNRLVRRRGDEGLRGVGTAAGASAGGVLAAIVQGSRVDAGESLLPGGRLEISTQAERDAFRQRYVGPALLGVASLGMTVLGGYATIGVVNDLRAWHRGIEVPAELKGSTSTKLILSVLDVELAWQMPNETTPRHDSRWIMTLWMPDENAGAVRALPNDPSVATFEEAVDLIPLRAPLILALFGLAVGSVVSARSQRKNADKVQHIGDAPVEGRLVDPSIVTQTTNGAVTGHTLSGTLDGLPVTTTLAANVDLDSLVFADASSALVVIKSADGAWWVPLFADGEPFAWRGADLARAQAVLIARGSSSVLREPAI